MPFGNRKINFRGSFQFSFVTFKKKYHPSGNLKLNYLGIFQSFILRILMGKILLISSLEFHATDFGLFWVNVHGKKWFCYGNKIRDNKKTFCCCNQKCCLSNQTFC